MIQRGDERQQHGCQEPGFHQGTVQAVVVVAEQGAKARLVRRPTGQPADVELRDDVLLLPLLSHRDPALWDAPDSFRPERWKDLDPDTTPGYLPFGHSSERCWGRHMVMPLAELLLDLIRGSGLGVDPDQWVGKVPLLGLLGVDDVRLTHRA